VDGRRDDVALPPHHSDRLDIKRDRLAGQQVEVAATGADRGDMEARRVGGYNLESLGADRTC
jgi:hypothetical protein